MTKRVYFLIEDGELLEKYNKIGNKVGSILKKYLIANHFTIKNI